MTYLIFVAIWIVAGVLTAIGFGVAALAARNTRIRR